MKPKHNPQITMALLACKVRERGMELRMDKSGVYIGKRYGPVFSINHSEPTLWRMWLWLRDCDYRMAREKLTLDMELSYE